MSTHRSGLNHVLRELTKKSSGDCDRLAEEISRVASKIWPDDGVAFATFAGDCVELVRVTDLSPEQVQQIPFMSQEKKLQGTQLGREIQDEMNRYNFERSLLQSNRDSAMQKLSGVIRCSKCRSQRISINQKQSRAADEGMTLYCLCECGHAWKM